MRFAKPGEPGFVDVAHVHARALAQECLRGRKADAGGAGGDEHACAVKLEIHRDAFQESRSSDRM